MVDRYVEDKIRDALEQSGGSRLGAMKLIAEAAQSDERLVRGLAQPHFQGLVAYATDKVMRKHDIKAVPEPDHGPHQGRGQRVKQQQKQPQELDADATNKILNRLRQRAHKNAQQYPDPDSGQPQGKPAATGKAAKGGGGEKKPAAAAASSGNRVSQEQGLAAVVADAKRQHGLEGNRAGKQHVSAVRSLAKGRRGREG